MPIFTKNSVFMLLMLVWPGSRAFAQASPAERGEASSNVDPSSPKDGSEPVDYKSFTHTIFIEAFRGGSYEKEGVSRYYFKVSMLATQAGKGEAEDAKKVTTPIGTFGELSLKSLDIWKRDDKTKGAIYEQRIDGDLVRDTVARAMLEWLVPEREVQIAIHVELWRHAKRFGLLGEDAKVAEAKYQLIPQASDAGGQTPAIVMSDDKGVMVRLVTKFDRVGSGSKEKKDK